MDIAEREERYYMRLMAFQRWNEYLRRSEEQHWLQTGKLYPVITQTKPPPATAKFMFSSNDQWRGLVPKTEIKSEIKIEPLVPIKPEVIDSAPRNWNVKEEGEWLWENVVYDNK